LDVVRVPAGRRARQQRDVQEVRDQLLGRSRGVSTADVVGPRLVACANAALAVEGRSALEIFGSPDDSKLRSCATLFAQVSPAGSVFHRLLDKYFHGEPDEATLLILAQLREP
jgi:uncharacterized protein (DUF1810 family)